MVVSSDVNVQQYTTAQKNVFAFLKFTAQSKEIAAANNGSLIAWSQ